MLHLINETARRVNETKTADLELGGDLKVMLGDQLLVRSYPKIFRVIQVTIFSEKPKKTTLKMLAELPISKTLKPSLKKIGKLMFYVFNGVE